MVSHSRCGVKDKEFKCTRESKKKIFLLLSPCIPSLWEKPVHQSNPWILSHVCESANYSVLKMATTWFTLKQSDWCRFRIPKNDRVITCQRYSQMFVQSLWLSNFGCKYHSLMVRWFKEDKTGAAELHDRVSTCYPCTAERETRDEHRQGKWPVK